MNTKRVVRITSLVVAASVFVVVGLVTTSASVDAGCEPLPKKSASKDHGQSTGGQANDITEATTVEGKARNHKSTPHDGGHDKGKAKRTTMNAPAVASDTTKKSCLSVGAYVYLWAEDGETSTLTFTEANVRDWTFWTECKEIPPHTETPPGGTHWLVDCDVLMRLTVGANGHTDAGFSRALDTTLAADLITNRNFRLKYKVEDNPVHTNKTITALGGASIGQEQEVSAAANSQKHAGIALKKAQKSQVGGTIAVEVTQEWTSNTAIAYTDRIALNDKVSFRTWCHDANKDDRTERVEVLGSYTVTAPNWTWSSNLMHIEADAFVQICTRAQSRPYRICGGSTAIAYAADWDQYGIDESLPVGEQGAHNAQQRNGGAANGGADLIPTDSRKYLQSSTDFYAFHVIVGNGGDQDVHVRAKPGQGGLTISSIRAESPNGAVVVNLADDAGVFSAALPEGNWALFATVECDAAGTYYLQAVFEPETFDEGPQVASSCMEAAPFPLSPAFWAMGVHTETSTAPRTVPLDSVMNIVPLECIADDAPDPQDIEFSWSADPNTAWADEPALVHDAATGRWFVTMEPLATADVTLTLILGETSVLQFPVHYAVDE